jgi:hypothetical protein
MSYQAQAFYDRIEGGDDNAWEDAILVGEPIPMSGPGSQYVRGVEFSDHSYLLETKDGETKWGPDLSKVKLS